MRMHSRKSKIFDADLASCRAALNAGSKSFAGASRLLPREVCDSATALYAFCREADDAVDLHRRGAQAVDDLRDRLDKIYAGNPRSTSVDRAVCAVVTRHQLPRLLLDALIEGFEWDAAGRRYETLSELCDYAARVAGTIGAMMAIIMGVRAPSVLAKACDLGVAMQLTNIARDVGEDARGGRIYLPLNWLKYAGIDVEEWLKNPQMSDRLKMVIDGLLKEADFLYDGVDSAIAQLPRACRPGINAARFIYADIGRVVRGARCDSVSRRAFVPRSRKLLLVTKAFAVVMRPAVERSTQPIAATAYLVHGLTAALLARNAAESMPAAPVAAIPWWRLRSRGLWLLELLERIERRDRITPIAG